MTNDNLMRVFVIGLGVATGWWLYKLPGNHTWIVPLAIGWGAALFYIDEHY